MERDSQSHAHWGEAVKAAIVLQKEPPWQPRTWSHGAASASRTLMPLDEGRSKEWKVCLAYRATATLNAEVVLEQRPMFDTIRLRIIHVLRT